MSLASTWIQTYTITGLSIDEARAVALEKLNKALGTNHTRGDCWRWEQGAGMRPDRREFMLREVVPHLCKQRRWKLTDEQVEEVIEALL